MAGLLVGGDAVLGLFAFGLGLGVVEVTGSSVATSALAAALGTVLIVALLEETIFRAFALRGLETLTGSRMWALLGSSILYGASYLGHPGATPMLVLSVLTGGIVLGMAALWSERVWLPLGLNAGWHLALLLTGVAPAWPHLGLLETSVSGPAWLVGTPGANFESGLVSLIAWMAAFGLIWLWTRRRTRPSPLVA